MTGWLGRCGPVAITATDVAGQVRAPSVRAGVGTAVCDRHDVVEADAHPIGVDALPIDRLLADPADPAIAIENLNRVEPLQLGGLIDPGPPDRLVDPLLQTIGRQVVACESGDPGSLFRGGVHSPAWI